MDDAMGYELCGVMARFSHDRRLAKINMFKETLVSNPLEGLGESVDGRAVNMYVPYAEITILYAMLDVMIV
jgi:hypothetical protein